MADDTSGNSLYSQRFRDAHMSLSQETTALMLDLTTRTLRMAASCTDHTALTLTAKCLAVITSSPIPRDVIAARAFLEHAGLRAKLHSSHSSLSQTVGLALHRDVVKLSSLDSTKQISLARILNFLVAFDKSEAFLRRHRGMIMSSEEQWNPADVHGAHSGSHSGAGRSTRSGRTVGSGNGSGSGSGSGRRANDSNRSLKSGLQSSSLASSMLATSGHAMRQAHPSRSLSVSPIRSTPSHGGSKTSARHRRDDSGGDLLTAAVDCIAAATEAVGDAGVDTGVDTPAIHDVGNDVAGMDCVSLPSPLASPVTVAVDDAMATKILEGKGLDAKRRWIANAMATATPSPATMAHVVAQAQARSSGELPICVETAAMAAAAGTSVVQPDGITEAQEPEPLSPIPTAVRFDSVGRSDGVVSDHDKGGVNASNVAAEALAQAVAGTLSAEELVSALARSCSEIAQLQSETGLQKKAIAELTASKQEMEHAVVVANGERDRAQAQARALAEEVARVKLHMIQDRVGRLVEPEPETRAEASEPLSPPSPLADASQDSGTPAADHGVVSSEAMSVAAHANNATHAVEYRQQQSSVGVSPTNNRHMSPPSRSSTASAKLTTMHTPKGSEVRIASTRAHMTSNGTLVKVPDAFHVTRHSHSKGGVLEPTAEEAKMMRLLEKTAAGKGKAFGSSRLRPASAGSASGLGSKLSQLRGGRRDRGDGETMKGGGGAWK